MDQSTNKTTNEWVLEVVYGKTCSTLGALLLAWQKNHSVGCTKSKDRHTVGRSCLFWSSVFATICPLKNLPNFRHFDDFVLNLRIHFFLFFFLHQLLLVCLLLCFLLLLLLSVYFSCTWRRQFSVESACPSLFPCVSSYRWIHFPRFVLSGFFNLTSSCSLIPQKKNVFFHIHEITRVTVLYTSLRFVEGVYKPQRACVGWASVTVFTIVSRSVHVNQMYLFGWISPRPP